MRTALVRRISLQAARGQGDRVRKRDVTVMSPFCVRRSMGDYPTDETDEPFRTHIRRARRGWRNGLAVVRGWSLKRAKGLTTIRTRRIFFCAVFRGFSK